jgi:hypothetical protein
MAHDISIEISDFDTEQNLASTACLAVNHGTERRVHNQGQGMTVFLQKQRNVWSW